MSTASQSVLIPELLAENLAADQVKLSLRIPAELAYFKGHFDEIAVVPGVGQIQWAVHYAQQYLGLNREFSHMDVIKFKELLLPGQLVELSLRYLAHTGKLEFCYRSDSCEYSSGRIYFHYERV